MPKQSTPILGFLNINKPKGITSHDVINKIRRITGIKRIGHTGTLDPFATGVLLVAVGPTTRLIRFTDQQFKEYEATIILGKSSDTDDLTGNIVELKQTIKPTTEQINTVIQKFIGTIKQTPPIYSALKFQGKKLYDYARDEQVLLKTAEKIAKDKTRYITIKNITVKKYSYPKLSIVVECGSGTYIRALARDIGKELKTSGYLSILKRTKIGQMKIKNSTNLKQLENTNNWKQYLQPIELFISHLPKIIVSSENVAKLRQGNPVSVSKPIANNTETAIFSSDNFLIGIAIYDNKHNILSPVINLQYENEANN